MRVGMCCDLIQTAVRNAARCSMGGKRRSGGRASVHANAAMSKQPLYGFPCVTDPNDFLPDYESCSPEEIATWKRACETFGQPEHEPNKGCFSEYSADGKLVQHVTRTSWGIGTNLIASCDGCREPDYDGLIVCHECGGPEFCPHCWPEHEKKHDEATT